MRDLARQTSESDLHKREDTERLLFLSQYFHPEDGATSQLLSGIAFELAARGFSVSALSGQPSYFEAQDLPRNMVHEGVSIRRVWSTQFNKNTALGRVVNSLTFSVSTLLGLLFEPRRAVTISVTNPPLLMWVCYAARRLRGRRYITVIHDVYPQIAVALGALSEKGIVARLWTYLNRRSLAAADRIVVLGRDMRDVIQRDLPPGQSNKIDIIANWADGESIVPLNRDCHPIFDELGVRDRFVVQYSGNIGRFHEIETILEAQRKLNSTGDFSFVFYGKGHQVERVRNAAAEAGDKSVIWSPIQPRERLGLTLTGCDVGLVTLKEGLAGLAVPSKLYGVLAAGKPVIVVGPVDCEAARVITEEGCGIVVSPRDSQGLADALLRLRKSPEWCAELGTRARAAFERRFDIGTITRQWEALLARL
jgi:colanic acid biosynthesis glycosyl transferase WcaI